MKLTILGILAWALGGAASAADGEINVALQKWGASAQASSIYAPGYEADRVLDGKMTGEHDKWNSAAQAAAPHWLVIDLGRKQPVHRVAIHHEGVRSDGNKYNTGRFQLQRGNSPAGPWTDLVPPVVDNHGNRSELSFAPVPVRYLRLWITQGEQGGKNEFARIFEVEAYAQKEKLTEPLAGLAWAMPAEYRKTEAGGIERLAVLEMVSREGGGQEKPTLTVAGKPIIKLAPNQQTGIWEFWMPLTTGDKATAVLVSAGGTVLARHEFAVSGGEYFSGGSVSIVSSSHQDTAWMDTPDACRRFRIEQNLMPALEMMKKDKTYCFAMECTLHLMEFLEAHPERRAEVAALMKEGRLEWGATYNQPYESWLSGEELIRQAYYGRRWITKNFPGCDAKVAFNPDVPARAWQMQQILAKAGIPYLFTSRYHEGLYRWASPDGSSVLMYTPGHYCNPMGLLQQAPASAVQGIQAKLEEQGGYYAKRQIPPAYCLINSADFSKPSDFSPLITQWQVQAALKDALPAPKLRYGSILDFFTAIDKPQAKFDRAGGERPDVWLYITGPTHHWTSSIRREAARLLPAAETFTTFASLLKGDFHDWPTKAFDQAWMDEIYIDHGIGGKNGHITDEVFYRKVENARDAGARLLGQALDTIACQVKAQPAAATPVAVFNTLSWTRSAPVAITVPETLAGPVHIEDSDGKEVPSQSTALGLPDEVNVAAAQGARATASSMFSPAYDAGKAIDGKWAVQDPNDGLGASDKWNSVAGAGPHWLAIDLGRPRTIHRVVVRHEGVLGVFRDETRFNTADFQIQGADAAAGPWTDLVPPVVGNTLSLTTHDFAPATLRFLRILITKGTQPGADQIARIYEVQAFAKAPVPPRQLVFVATDVPALGYKTYRLAAGEPKVAATSSAATPEGCENQAYRVELAPGGIKGIYDKRQKRELLNTGKFLGGEVFTMLSVAPNNRGGGTDAGEFGAIPMPVPDASFDRVADHKPAWKIIEQGPVRIVYQLEQPLADTTVRQRVIVWQQLKQIDCEADLLNFNGRLWREFRLALPLALEKPQLAYEVPMGVVEIGKDEVSTTGGHAYGGLTYFEQCKDIRPRMVQNFIDASDGNGGLTMSTSAAAFDWIDPTAAPVAYPVLQPVLLASRKSCNGEGVWYPQAGDHQYRFSISSHAGGWRNGRQDGIAANHPLQAVVGVKPAPGAALPPEMSFASVSASNVMVGTIKKCEDDNSVIVRLYDIEGKDSTATLKLFKPVKNAEQTNIIEEGGKPLPVKKGTVEIPVGHHAIETIKIRRE